MPKETRITNGRLNHLTSNVTLFPINLTHAMIFRDNNLIGIYHSNLKKAYSVGNKEDHRIVGDMCKGYEIRRVSVLEFVLDNWNNTLWD